MSDNKREIKKVGKYLDLPGGLISGLHIEMFGNSEISVEGIKGVCEYDDCMVVLNSSKSRLIINGCSLEIKSLTLREVTVAGKISSVEFECC